MFKTKENLIGKKFNRLTVVGILRVNKHVYYDLVCDCGNKSKAYGNQLKSGRIKSCGCLNKERIVTHNLSRTSIYKIWQGILQRCTNINDHGYNDYGGRGITVCNKWLTFEGFYEDMGDRPDGLTLDRKNNNLGYCKENCRWATSIIQQNNKRNNTFVKYNDKTQTVAQWARELGISYQILIERISKCKWSVERAFTQKVEFHDVSKVKKRKVKIAESSQANI